MNISAVPDLSSVLIQQATAMKAGQTQQAIQVDVLKQTLDQQKATGEAIVQMLQNSPVPKAIGGNVDTSI